MFRVSVKEDPSGLALDVEGRLAGPWVAELEECWKREEARTGEKLCSVRLCAVTFIDDAGKQLLSRMHKGGAILQGNGCMVRAIVAGITRGSVYGGEEKCTDRPAIARPSGEK